MISLLTVVFLFQACKTPNQSGKKKFSLEEIFSFSDETDDLRISEFIDSTILTPDARRFYQKRAYATAWVDDKKISKNGEELLEELKHAGEEGLQESFYDVPKRHGLERTAKFNSAMMFMILTNYPYLCFANQLNRMLQKDK